MTPEEIEAEIVRICHEMDAVRVNSTLTEKKKARRLEALHTEARTLRQPVKHVGSGRFG